MKKVKYLTIQNSKAPERKTQPRSSWRDLMVGMKAGQWMLLRKEDHGRVAVAASAYVKGCYTLYKVPEGYCFKKIK